MLHFLSIRWPLFLLLVALWGGLVLVLNDGYGPQHRLRAWVQANLDAQHDLYQGTPKYKEYGALPSVKYAEALARVTQAHGVEIERVAGCVVTEELVAYVEAYNAAIARGLGLPKEAWNTR